MTIMWKRNTYAVPNLPITGALSSHAYSIGAVGSAVPLRLQQKVTKRLEAFYGCASDAVGGNILADLAVLARVL